jgi:tetratricopeptide (TPR) repeat protein
MKIEVNENIQKFISRIGQPSTQMDKEGTLEKIISEGITEYHDFESHGNLQSLDQAISKFEAVERVVSDSDPRFLGILNNLGAFFLRRFEQLGRVADIDNGIERLRMVVGLTSDAHPDKFTRLGNLGNAFRIRFEQSGNLDDIDGAITQLQSAVNLTPDDHTLKPIVLSNLGESFQIRFKRLDNLEDLDSAITWLESSINLTPRGHSDRPARLSTLGNALRIRFERLGSLTDIDNSITRLQSAVNLTSDDHPEKPAYLSCLGISLLTRFERFGKLADIDGSITQQQSAVNFIPDNHPLKPLVLDNLGNSLRARFERLGNLADIEDAVTHQQLSVNLTLDGHLEKPIRLNNLGNTLWTRFEQLKNLADIDNAITQLQSAIKLTPDDHPVKLNISNNLGNSLRARFERLGNLADLEGAITQQQSVVNLTPDSHPDKYVYLSNLGNSLWIRFERLGNLGDIDNAITQLQSAIKLIPDDHTLKPTVMNNLANSLQARFERLENMADLEDAIVQQQSVVNLTPDDHPDKPTRLSNLGNSLLTRFERLKVLADLNDAITHLQSAVNLTLDDHPDRHTRLNNLGNSLRTRFEHSGNLVDIDGAITYQQSAINLTPDNQPTRHSRLSNLGIYLLIRFQRLGNLVDIDNAITQQQLAINLTPDGHPHKPTFFTNLGRTFSIYFRRSQLPSHAEAAISLLSASAQSPFGSPATRFSAVQHWIIITSLINHHSLLTAYECAIGLMPLVAWLGLPISDRHRHLIQIGGIARDAVSAAISFKQYEKALEWLEQGRSIVWNQILQLRTPVDELRAVDSDLADHLLEVSQLLDRGVEGRGSLGSTEEDAQQYRALTTEWELTIKKIRSLPNFEDFLGPLKASSLKDAARNGPVVIFNVAKERCDALALPTRTKEIIHIPLPDITLKRITELRDELKDLLYSNGVRLRGQRAAQKWTDENDSNDCKTILAELWKGLVKPVLDSLSFSVRLIRIIISNPLTYCLQPHPDVLPRIWWCATGPLAFLPIHAAGIYGLGQNSNGVQLSDYAISSYIPTLSSLLETVKPTTDSTFKLLSVIQPSAPGVSHIPHTKKELECIQLHLGNREHVVLNSHQGTKQRVKNAMADSNWLHLACHGSQRQDEPTKSGLILEDGHLTLEEIVKLDLPKAEFAYLSACQTTTGDEALSDEAVHIAGGMLLAGYRGVVATMWSIEDNLAPEIADEFYRRIMPEDGRPDSRRAAEALHFAVQKLRKKENIPLTSWIPFVHLGV